MPSLPCLLLCHITASRSAFVDADKVASRVDAPSAMHLAANRHIAHDSQHTPADAAHTPTSWDHSPCGEGWRYHDGRTCKILRTFSSVSSKSCPSAKSRLSPCQLDGSSGPDQIIAAQTPSQRQGMCVIRDLPDHRPDNLAKQSINDPIFINLRIQKENMSNLQHSSTFSHSNFM